MQLHGVPTAKSASFTELGSALRYVEENGAPIVIKADGFLTPFKVKRVQTTIDEYVYTADDDVIEGEVEEGYLYKETDFNKKIEIEARERKRVKTMQECINADEKTLVFCANQAHAAKIRDLINEESKGKPADYCVRVTANDGKIGEQYLLQFRDNEKTIPTILTTSQKLSTGVDARNVRNIVLLRPVNSMIEFKQIIGRGTRVFEGKHYFTIVDFVNAYHMFSDAEWDGDELELEDVGEDDGREEDGKGDKKENKQRERDEEDEEEKTKPKLRIRLSDGKTRELKSMTSTLFYVDGKPISAEEFLKRLFDTVQLPKLLGSEDELRTAWSNPITRRDLLEQLEQEGCYKDDLLKLQEIIDAEHCDLFDVLEYIAYLKQPVTRAARVKTSEQKVYNLLNEQQRDFVRYVLQNYVKDGVDELDDKKLGVILQAKYGSLPDAQRQLGSINEIRTTFIDFQQHLYSAAVG